MKRWSRRILLGLVILLVVAAIVIQIVLWTDYPRRIVLSLVQRELGLRVEATGMSTGWFGSTTLSDVKLSLPLAPASFLDVPSMEVDHTSLLPLIITQKFQLTQIELRQPTLVVQRDSAGRWNVEDVAELLGKAGGGTPEPGTKKKPPRLPRLRLTNGTINIIERNGQKAVIHPVTVIGNPDGPLVYRYDAQVPNRLKAVGQVAPGEDWKHEAQVFADPGDWLKPWMPQPPTPLVINARWAGIVHEKKLVGRLLLEEGKFEVYGARGRVLVQAGGGTTVLNPQELVITTPLGTLPNVQFTSGTMHVEGNNLRAQQLRVAAVGGDALVNGIVNLADNSADLSVNWVDLTAPGGITHGGNVAVQVRSPFPDRPEVDATIITRGRTPDGNWDGRILVEGRGKGWSSLDWLIRAERLVWDAKFPIEVDNFSARVSHRGQVLTLTEVNWPNHHVFASGKFDMASQSWALRLSGQETVRTTFDFNVDAGGDRERIRLNDLLLRARGLELKASGVYVLRVPKPVDLRIYITHVPQDLAEVNEEPWVRGTLDVEGNLSGTVWPRELKATGTLRTRDLVALKRDFGNMRGVIDGVITGDNADFTVRDLALLGGAWQIKGVWPYTGADRLIDTDALRVRVRSDNVAIKEVGDLLGAKELAGTAQGEWNIDIPFPHPRRDSVAMDGSFRATDFAAGEFRVDEITGKTTLRHGVIKADPVMLKRAERDVIGTATLTLATTTAQPDKPTVQLAAQSWPVRLGTGALAALTADAQLAIDAKTKSATGPLTAKAIFSTTQRTIGEATVNAHLDGRVATLEKIMVDAAGGHAEGRGAIDADDPNRTTMTLGWEGMTGERLSDLLPHLKGLTGTYAGALAIAPATAERALEPLRLTLGITPQNGRYKSIDVGPMKMSAFLNVQPDFSVARIVLDELPSEIQANEERERQLAERGVPLKDRPLGWNDLQIADGRVRLWARRGQHTGGEVQTHLIAQFSRLDVNQLVHAIKHDADPMPARISGSITLHGDPQVPELLLGQGEVQVTESDLGNVDALAVLYNAVRLGQATTQPTGHGSLDVSLQASTLSLQNIRYFNRGVEARSSSVDISDVWLIPRSPIFGYVFGSARPLKDLRLPWLADVDQILNVLQSNVTTVKVDGTVEEPNARLVPFNEASDALKRFIVGEVRGEKRGKR